MSTHSDVARFDESQSIAPAKINFALDKDSVLPGVAPGTHEQTVTKAGLSNYQIEANGSLNFLPVAHSRGDTGTAQADHTTPHEGRPSLPNEVPPNRLGDTGPKPGDQQPKITKNADGSEVTDYGEGRTSTRYPDGRTVEEVNKPPYHYRKETQPDGSFNETITNGQTTETNSYNKKTDTLTTRRETPDEWTEEQYGPGHRTIYSKHFNKKTGRGVINRPGRDPEPFFEI